MEPTLLLLRDIHVLPIAQNDILKNYLYMAVFNFGICDYSMFSFTQKFASY